MTEHRDKRDIAGQSGTCPGQYCRDGRDTPLGGVPVVPLADTLGAHQCFSPLSRSNPHIEGEAHG